MAKNVIIQKLINFYRVIGLFNNIEKTSSFGNISKHLSIECLS